MDGTMSKYPCKPFPYGRLPYEFKYPCRNLSKGVEAKPTAKAEEGPPADVEVESRISRKRGGVKYPPLKQQCSFPYFRSCRHYCRHWNFRSNFTGKWERHFLNQLEKEKEDIVCISPVLKDSYEVLCNIPLCESKPPVNIKLRKAFNPVHCVFCDKSLYTRGIIYDIRESVPAIKRQSTDEGDDIAERIGFRSRITVHKSCFEDYIKRPVTYLLEYDPNEC